MLGMPLVRASVILKFSSLQALSRSVSSSSATINSGPLEYCCGSTPEQVCPPCSGQAHWVNHPAPQEPLPLNKCLFTKLVAVVLDELTHRSECTAVMEHYVVKQDLWYWFLKICILKVSGVKQSSLVL